MVAESVYQSLVDRLVKKPQVSLALTLFPIQEAVKNNRGILVGKAVHFSVVADEGILILADIQNFGWVPRMLEQMYQIHEIKNSRTLVCKLHGPIFNPVHIYEEPIVPKIVLLFGKRFYAQNNFFARMRRGGFADIANELEKKSILFQFVWLDKRYIKEKKLRMGRQFP